MIQAACSARLAQAALPAKCTGQPSESPTPQTPTETGSGQAATIDTVATVTSDTETPGGGKKTGRAHGVLRLLEAGHFKPKPEYRHRLHLADLLHYPEPEENPAIDDGVSEPTIVDEADDGVNVAPPPEPPPTGELEPLDAAIGVPLSLVDFFA
jgi:hypothetical protein